MPKIIDQCREIRQLLKPYIQQHEKRQYQKDQETKEWHERAVRHIMRHLCEELTEKICNGCGDNFYAPVCIPNNCLNLDEVHQTILNTYGLKLVFPDPKNKDYIKIAPGSEIRRCIVVQKSSSKLLLIDFPKLLNEDRRRAEVWSKALPTLAKQIITVCKQHLEAMPNKFYGIPSRQSIVDTNNHNAFANKKIPFDDFEVKYDDLNKKQRTELQTAMEQLVSHASISISTGNHPDFYLDSLWITFYKKPEKTVENPFFDYAEFYQKYEQITPELQEHFDYIAEHITLPAAESQFLTLTPELKLTYEFSNEAGPDWNIMQIRFTEANNEALLKSLSSHLETVFSGIRITKTNFKCDHHSSFSPRGCGPHGYTTNKRIEFTYEIFAPNCEIAKQTLEICKAIDNIKLKRHHRAARELTKHILASIKQKLENGYGIPLIRNQSIANELSDAELIVTIDQHLVNLDEVTDLDFLKRVSALIYDQSNGLISVDLIKAGTKRFELHP